MKPLHTATLLLLLLALVGSSGDGSKLGSGTEENERIFKEYGFPSHEGLTHLCRQRVYGSGREITWDAFASTAVPAELVQYYRRKLGDAGFEKDGEGGMWR